MRITICRIKTKAYNFRLVIIAEKEDVYTKFPLPLINRLEKHFLTTETCLSAEQKQVAEDVHAWAESFAKITVTSRRTT